MNLHRCILLGLIFLITSCSSGHLALSQRIRSLVKDNKHDEAIQLITTGSLAQDQNSKLLYHVELGLVQHYKGDYEASIETLNTAKSILDELFTTSASGKIKSVIINDNSDFYYGEKYEASLIYFYLSLNHYLRAQLEFDETKKSLFLRQARAEILAWDTFLSEIKKERLGQARFKEDLLAKTFGALIHESQKNNNDDQIALQLYKDANEVLFKYYNLFPTYNNSYQVFTDNFKNLHNLPLKEVEGKYVMATPHSEEFKNFLSLKILMLTKKIRPRELKEQISKLNPSQETLNKLNSTGTPVTFLLQEGLIVEKGVQRYEFPINWGNNRQMAGILALGSVISFELPYIASVPHPGGARVQALDQNGVVVSEAPLSVIAPLGDLAKQAINEHTSAIATKTGVRLAAKHVAALAVTYAAYQANRKNNPELAGAIAGLTHSAAVALINESEKADTRFWSTLPANIRMSEMRLNNGTYRFRAVYGQEGSPNYRVVDIGEKTIQNKSLNFVMSGSSIKVPPKRELASVKEN